MYYRAESTPAGVLPAGFVSPSGRGCLIHDAGDTCELNVGYVELGSPTQATKRQVTNIAQNTSEAATLKAIQTPNVRRVFSSVASVMNNGKVTST